jgi:FixJ family two-component response regulator
MLIGIVDDDQAVRESISSLVRSAGYESAIFESAESFLASDRVQDMDCLVVDFHMPVLDGLNLHRLLVEMNHSTPIILISARDDEIRERALKQGVVAVFGKPFSDEALLRAIQSALPGMTRPRVLLADDEPDILKSVKALLAGEFDVVGEVMEGNAVLEEAARLGPDVVVLDVSMPGGGGLQALPLLRERLPSAAIVVVTAHQSPVYSEQAFRRGADAYVLKWSASSDLIPAIHNALATRRVRPRHQQ